MLCLFIKTEVSNSFYHSGQKGNDMVSPGRVGLRGRRGAMVRNTVYITYLEVFYLVDRRWRKRREKTNLDAS